MACFRKLIHISMQPKVQAAVMAYIALRNLVLHMRAILISGASGGGCV
jgi:hypothetical protein